MRVCLVSVLCFSSLILSACSTTGATTVANASKSAEACKPVTEQEIASLFERWNSSLQTGDALKVVANYDEKSILLPTVSDTPRFTSAEKIDYFEHFLKAKPAGSIDKRLIQIGCNNALDAGLYTFKMGSTGKIVKARYSYTYKWNGKDWLITSHHSSMLPEQFLPKTANKH